MKYLKRLGRFWVGIFAGLVIGLILSGAMPVTKEMQLTGFALLMTICLIVAFSRMPIIGDVMRSAQRAFMHGWTKGKMEQFLWQNGLVAVIVAALVNTLAHASTAQS